MAGRPTKRTGTVRLDAGHVVLPRGKIYCREYWDSEDPKITHSSVKCALCGKTVQTSRNPPLATAERLRAAAKYLEKGGIPGTLARRLITKAMTYGLSLLGPDERQMIEYSLERSKNPMPSATLIAAKLVRRGYDDETARDMAEREIEQAALLLATPRSNRKRVPAHMMPARNPLRPKVGGYRGEKSPVHIYGETEKIFMRKTRGPYKGKRFVHDFKKGVEQVGFPRGTVLKTPDGKMFRVTTRSVMLTGKKDLWKRFAA